MNAHFKRDSDFNILEEIRTDQKQIIQVQQEILQNQASFKVTLQANTEKIKEHETIFYGINRTNGIINTLSNLAEDQENLSNNIKRERKFRWQYQAGILAIISVILAVLRMLK